VTLSLGTAYRSFGGEVEASSTPTICRLSDSRRHQISAIAQMTLRELLTRYCAEVTPGKRGAVSEASRINSILRCPMSHRTLAKLTSADIASYRDERLKSVAPATVVRELNTVSHAIEIATREWGLWLPRNPVKLVRRPQVP